jgi:pimeloyl-ACP methyl ester carboxylesterase
MHPEGSDRMTTEEVRFFSAGATIAGTLKLPDSASAPVAAVVQGPGWLGLRDGKNYVPYHDGLLAAGIAVLVFDHRGFGDSTDNPALPAYIDPMGQVADYRAAVSYLCTRPEIDARRIGAFGSGGTGGGNAIYAGALDPRVQVVVAQLPIADGRDWLHRMRREHEWLDFLDQVRQADLRYAATGERTMVSPREGIMVATPERKTTTVKADVDHRVPDEVDLLSAQAIFAYRPIDVIDRIAPRGVMLIAVEHDAVTPEDHIHALYERAAGPKRLVVQTGTTHYGSYAQYREVVNPLITDWFVRHLTAGEVLVHERPAEAEVIRLTRPPA